jgi:hypothetical protein
MLFQTQTNRVLWLLGGSQNMFMIPIRVHRYSGGYTAMLLVSTLTKKKKKTSAEARVGATSIAWRGTWRYSWGYCRSSRAACCALACSRDQSDPADPFSYQTYGAGGEREDDGIFFVEAGFDRGEVLDAAAGEAAADGPVGSTSMGVPAGAAVAAAAKHERARAMRTTSGRRTGG